MAEQRQIRVVDDLDPTKPGEKRAVLGFNNLAVSLDLCDENYQKLASMIEPYMQAGQPLSNVNLLRDDVVMHLDMKDVRVWAIKQGETVPRRGKLPERVVDRYITEVVQVAVDAP